MRSTIAVLALVIGTTAFVSTEAYARDPDKEIPVEVAAAPRDPGHDTAPAPSSPVAHATPSSSAGVVQNGASALGGAAVACGVMWVYRRRARLAD